MRLRKKGALPPVYPNGWFALLDSDQVIVNQVKYVTALGKLQHYTIQFLEILNSKRVYILYILYYTIVLHIMDKNQINNFPIILTRQIKLELSFILIN